VLGEATVHCNLGASYEMLCNLDTALEHHNEVSVLMIDYKLSVSLSHKPNKASS